tara:strand:+ start:111 stop:557 length:447 start_codon:yes stop_codon:yes gene_type:complete
LFKSLKNILNPNNQNTSIENYDYLSLLCGLMIEAANADGEISDIEVEKINNILVDSFKENPSDVKIKLDEALANSNNSNSLFFYTSKFNKEYNYQKKILLIEKMWEVILSDENVHDYETSLIRRLCGLLYISDVDSGNAKKRALDNLS